MDSSTRQVIFDLKISRNAVLFLLEIGPLMNWEKSELEPTPITVLIGLRLRTYTGMVMIPDDRMINNIKLISTFLRVHDRFFP